MMVTSNETFIGLNDEQSNLVLRPMNNFKYTPFYRKQHCILHATLSFMLVSMASSYIRRWRHCHEVQLVRTIVEPACMVTAAMIVSTHSHSGGGHGHGQHSDDPLA